MKNRIRIKTILMIFPLLTSTSFSKHILADISLGKPTAVRDTGHSLGGIVHLDLNLLYRFSDRWLAGFELDGSSWQWANPAYSGYNDLSYTNDINNGRGGLLLAVRAEQKFANEAKVFGQVGAGPYSEHRWANGGGVNGAGQWDYFTWRSGFNLQAGAGYKFVQIQTAFKQTFGDYSRNWLSFSIGLYREFF